METAQISYLQTALDGKILKSSIPDVIKYADANKMDVSKSSAIIAKYESETGKRVYWPDNEYHVMERIAMRWFHADSLARLENDNKRLHELLAMCVGYEKNWHHGRITCAPIESENDLDLAANVYHKLIAATHNFSEKYGEYIKTAQRKNIITWKPEELKSALVEFLREHSSGDAKHEGGYYNQDTLATEFSAKSSFVFQRLEELVARKDSLVKRTVKSKTGKERSEYRYAPEFIALSSDRKKFPERLKILVLAEIEKCPDINEHNVWKILNARLGVLHRNSVHTAVNELLEENRIEAQKIIRDNQTVLRVTGVKGGDYKCPPVTQICKCAATEQAKITDNPLASPAKILEKSAKPIIHIDESDLF